MLNMKKAAVTGGIILLVSLLLAPAAFGKAIQGEVSSVDLVKNSLLLDTQDVPSGETKQIQVSVNPDTRFIGIVSLKELTSGDVVLVSADQDLESGNWIAKSVKR